MSVREEGEFEGVRGLYRVKNQEGADVILQICEGGVASRTIDLFRVHIPLELPHCRFIETPLYGWIFQDWLIIDKM